MHLPALHAAADDDEIQRYLIAWHAAWSECELLSCICGAYVTALFNECQCRDSVGRCCSCCLALDSTAWAHLLAPFPFTGSPIPLLACWSSSSSQQAVACPTLPTATIYILTEYISTRMNHPHTRPFLSFVHTHSVLTVSKTHAS